MGRFASGYLGVQDAVGRRPTVPIAVLALLLAGACAGLGSLRLDLSFRPLFATGDEIAAPTEAFEAVFGQSSGAWIVAILENRSMEPPAFLREAARLASRVRGLPGITEVSSLTETRIAQWRDGALAMAAPIPAGLLTPQRDAELDARYRELLRGSRFVHWLVSADGKRLLLGARLAAPLDDLDARRRVVRSFQTLVTSEAAPGVGVQFSGVSVVELAYERQVLRDQLLATAVTTAVLVLLLAWTFRSAISTFVCLCPVMLTVPATLGVMGWLGQPVTIINTAIPVIILVIGVADAVHMLIAHLQARDHGADRKAAVRSMLEKTGKACLLTTITTVAGFAALCSADLVAVGTFGLCAAIGILFAWIANQILLPWMLRRTDIDGGPADGRVNRFADRVVTLSLRCAGSRPHAVLVVSVIVFAACCALIPSLEVDQRFNQELPAEHPVSVAQRDLEQDFGGFLGPEISIRRRDGAGMIDDASLDRLARFTAALRKLPETRQVWSVLDLLPDGVAGDQRRDAIDAMRAETSVSTRLGELVSRDADWLAVIVRIGDVGTRRAAGYRAEILDLARDTLGNDFDVAVVGQWWLAQYGMRLLLHDMLTSLGSASLIVLPLMWLAVRTPRLIVAATVANLLPLAVPLAFMAATGISLRIGTAVVLAVALGIIVDNTFHIVTRIQARADTRSARADPLEGEMSGTGRAVVITSLALVGGFLSMTGNQLVAIRDMGLVASVTIVAALLADLLVLPAINAVLASKPAAEAVSCVPTDR